MVPTKNQHCLRVTECALFLVLISVSLIVARPQPDAKASRKLSESTDIRSSAGRASDPGRPELVGEMDSFFVNIRENFIKTGGSPLLKSSKTSAVTVMFMKRLKAHRTWYSLIRTDKAGKIINEVVRIKGVSREKRTVTNQAWFQKMAADRKGYANLIKEDNGRYYLFWAEPVTAKIKGKTVFAGAVAAKIDFWDCFEQLADNQTIPFLIRVNHRFTLYDHLWSDTIKYTDNQLTIPGVDHIAVHIPGTQAIVTQTSHAVDTPAVMQTGVGSTRSPQQDAALAKTKKLHNTIVLSIVAVSVIILLILIAYLISMQKQSALIRKINRDD
jgi:hypothetical protein